MSRTIKILKVEPQRAPVVIEIEPGLESYQKEVGGFIEVVYPFPDPVALICNEEGKINGLPLNRALYDEYGDPYDIIAGAFLIVGADPEEEEFGGLTEKQINAYKCLFRHPEAFIKIDGKVMVSHIIVPDTDI